MATEVTPSKKVHCHCIVAHHCPPGLKANDTVSQAASAIEGLKMADSPAKKLDFTIENKENSTVAVPIAGIPELAELDEEETRQSSVAATIKPEEALEPLLQENPQRFVLFPIQNHEVSLPIFTTRRHA
jgi:hypothetical protein